ncbi:FAD-dependent oxidoreductase [Sediminispirochaeta bajacaliforniensis]|uniref:FAD-dependent oxidoreductase n=1 Tax=Sediminispirochaeta bajacaliforniensis TaxID=148 RepID=UPI000371B5C1|nr:FAD-dependent oxidoreductase [Sediminispirochaeta bajacaliforniensis]
MMINIKELKGADISCELCGINMQSPFILSSGPLSYAAEGLIEAHKAGAGAVVTKTIRLNAAINPTPHIGIVNEDSLINCEKWADSPPEVWFEREIPMTKAAGAVVIASIGHTLPEAEALVKRAEAAGADMIELVSYTEDTLLPMLVATKERVSIPVICKLSGNWPDPVGTARKCLEKGADAISAIDSLGPTLKIDIQNARPEMNSADGYGWLSGAAMRPVAMRIVSEIARNGCSQLVGIGGIGKAEDAVEYVMAGAQALGICSSLIIHGMDYLNKLCHDLSVLLDQLGYSSLTKAKGIALPNFPTAERVAKLEFSYEPYYAKCQAACPAGVDVPLYLDMVRKGNYVQAYETISVTNPFPGICGRVCDHPCEGSCRRSLFDDSLQIRLIKRLAADKTYESFGDKLPLPEMLPKNGKKLAVIGAGPAGLTAAYYLARVGYSVTIFESLPMAGGMLAVGIPEFRLPKNILKLEVDRVIRMGVEIRTGITIGRDLSIEELKQQGYERVLIATGAHGDPAVEIPGMDKEGVVSGVRFLRDLALGRFTSLSGKNVAVIGGGNAAVDAARSALRIGAASVTLLYRREREDMPAYEEEISEAEKEGVRYIFLAGPKSIEGNGKAAAFRYTPMSLGEIDESGRRKPVPSGAPSQSIDADFVIIATGQRVDTDFLPPLSDSSTGKTKSDGIYAAGDCTSETASVIEAIAAGRRSAQAIHQSLGGAGSVMETKSQHRSYFIEVTDVGSAKEESPMLPVSERLSGFPEVETGLSEDAARREAARCMHCGCINCLRCVAVCPYNARTLDFPIMSVDRELCRSCGACVSVCPTGALTATVVDELAESRI